VAPGEASLDSVGEGDSGIEMCSGDGAESEDEGHQGGGCGDGVAEKREGNVAAGEAIGHDSRADDGREQQQGTCEFCNQAPGK
jgi:hypothetical protein